LATFPEEPMRGGGAKEKCHNGALIGMAFVQDAADSKEIRFTTSAGVRDFLETRQQGRKMTEVTGGA
jgi:hypothetical protein